MRSLLKCRKLKAPTEHAEMPSRSAAGRFAECPGAILAQVGNPETAGLTHRLSDLLDFQDNRRAGVVPL